MGWILFGGMARSKVTWEQTGQHNTGDEDPILGAPKSSLRNGESLELEKGVYGGEGVIDELGRAVCTTLNATLRHLDFAPFANNRMLVLTFKLSEVIRSSMTHKCPEPMVYGAGC